MACTVNDKFGHNYLGGFCTVCKKSQRPVKKIEHIVNRARKKESPNGMHQLVGDIIKEFGGSFPFLMMITKRIGEQQMREWFSECRQADKKYSKIALLISKYKKFMKGIIWK